MDAESTHIRESGTLTMPDVLWARTKSVSAVIAPLAGHAVVGRAAVEAAATALGISRRQVYVLIKCHRDGSGLLTDLAPGRSSGGKGTARLSEEVEDLVREAVRKQFLTRQKRTLAAVYRDIAAACRARQLAVPARNMVEPRIRALNPVEVGRRRGGSDAVRPLQSAGDEVPTVGAILERVQIDHGHGRDRRGRAGAATDWSAAFDCRDRCLQPVHHRHGCVAGGALGRVGGTVPGTCRD